MRAIGYLDDRAEKTRRMIHGLEVLGPFARAEEIARARRADEIIIAGVAVINLFSTTVRA